MDDTADNLSEVIIEEAVWTLADNEMLLNLEPLFTYYHEIRFLIWQHLIPSKVNRT